MSAYYYIGCQVQYCTVLCYIIMHVHGSLHEFSENLGFPKIWEPNSSFWEPNPKFWDSGINLVFLISEVDAELPLALWNISFKRVGVRSGVA